MQCCQLGYFYIDAAGLVHGLRWRELVLLPSECEFYCLKHLFFVIGLVLGVIGQVLNRYWAGFDTQTRQPWVFAMFHQFHLKLALKRAPPPRSHHRSEINRGLGQKYSQN